MTKDIIKRQVACDGSRLTVDLWYPRTEGNCSEIEVGLVDVRAADSLLITYDFDRNGYSIKQASRFVWEEDEEIEHDWQEVAFIKAWARKKEEIIP